MIAHIVLFTPKASLRGADARAFASSVIGLLGQAESVERCFVGRAAVVDPGYARNMGDKTYEFAAVLEFRGQSELLAYLTSPMHADLGRLFWEHCDSTVISEVESVGLGEEAIEFLSKDR
jgi:hypothetical protein